MLELCEILGITVNELLSGERITTMEEYQKKAEQNMVDLQDKKAQDPFWENSASDYFAGVALGLFQDAKEEEINLNMNLYFNSDSELSKRIAVTPQIMDKIKGKVWFQ